MQHALQAHTPVWIAMFLYVLTAACLQAQNAAPAPGQVQKENAVSNHATGTFEVKVTPAEDADAEPGLGRFLLSKQFHGDIEGTSKGQMLGASTSVKGSAGYVAIERVTGTLAGRKGSFMLQHVGTMNKGTPQMNVSVVPDSGTDELVGLSGTMTIKIENGKHFYEFNYTIEPVR